VGRAIEDGFVQGGVRAAGVIALDGRVTYRGGFLLFGDGGVMGGHGRAVHAGGELSES
jgi:hypothetical protein